MDFSGAFFIDPFAELQSLQEYANQVNEALRGAQFQGLSLQHSPENAPQSTVQGSASKPGGVTPAHEAIKPKTHVGHPHHHGVHGPRGTPEPYMPMSISEDSQQFIIRVDLPGMDKSDLSITTVKGILTITGQRKDPNPEGVNYRRQERYFGILERKMKIPSGVHDDQATAEFTNGVLLICLPKKATEADTGHVITVL